MAEALYLFQVVGYRINTGSRSAQKLPVVCCDIAEQNQLVEVGIYKIG